MSHYEQQKFVEICFKYLKEENNFNQYTVIDVGSYDLNGSIKKLLPKEVKPNYKYSIWREIDFNKFVNKLLSEFMTLA